MKLCSKQYAKNGRVKGLSVVEISKIINRQRTNTSSDLNKLYKEGRIEKAPGKPVLHRIKDILQQLHGCWGYNKTTTLKPGVNYSLRVSIYRFTYILSYN